MSIVLSYFDAVGYTLINSLPMLLLVVVIILCIGLVFNVVGSATTGTAQEASGTDSADTRRSQPVHPVSTSYPADLSAASSERGAGYAAPADQRPTAASAAPMTIPEELGVKDADRQTIQQMLNMPPPKEPDPHLQDHLTRSNQVIRTQQYVIGALIIGMTIGQLVCILSVNTLEEARATLRTVAQVGIPTLVFAMLFYGGIFFFKLEHRWASFADFRRGLLLSLLLGAATILTLILVPPLLGEDALSIDTIVISVAINIIGDVIINFFEGRGEAFWMRRAQHRQHSHAAPGNAP
ncbi:hypothetical protein K2Z83_20280 [Oscillochloris sp. ZM17-4]|uniref:hypothetical protein n=1 Tax=Oscillochloris sp. ZM17-4 TaxID=2866714 RepID=UPI001C73BA4D|nr:hypothetical protein [Oscillochloris sp. ZM17-4]MBX0330009.1 hypothetical protein [Oscillochloris sp. ZM17-4]